MIARGSLFSFILPAVSTIALSVTPLSNLGNVNHISKSVSSFNTSVRSVEPTLKSSNTLYGWSYVNLQRSFGPDVTISGLTATRQGINVTVTGTHTVGNELLYTYALAPYDSQSGQLGSARQATAPVQYRGPFQLSWNSPNRQKYGEGLQKVSIVKAGQQVLTWPKSVLVYGDFSQIQPSGAVDNQIIGQHGNWLWVAMKGPASPPFTSHVYYQFRNWDRVIAINVHTGAYRLYQLPQITSKINPSNTTPAFAYYAGKVYIAFSDWIGALPSVPNASVLVEHDSAKAITLPILRPVPAATLQARWKVAQTELSASIRQEAGSIAYLWDHYIMNKNVPGVTGTTMSWMSDGLYINHGWMPQGILYGSEFPVTNGSSAEKIKNTLIKQLTLLVKNRLPSSVYALNTAKELKRSFHGRPPALLPGYRIVHNLYVPNPSTWPLPSAFRTYSDAFTAMGPLLAQASPYPVFIPAPSAIDNITPYWANVIYTVNNLGYNLQVYAGTKLRANSSSILAGSANTDFTLQVQAANQPLAKNVQWDMNVAIKNAKITHVNLGHGIVGTIYTLSSTSNQPAEQSVSWKEDGWTWGIQSGYPSNNPVAQAKQEIKSLIGLHLPEPTGQGVFSFGSDAPSQIEFTWMNARYVLYTTGWRAPQMAAAMLNLSSY